MTTTILVVAAAAGVAAVTMQPHHHVPPPEKSAAERGANAHYIYHKTWHKVNDSLPKGERSGAGSYPYTTPLHWELPDHYSGAYQGDPLMSGYYQMHEHGESGFLVANKYAYTGDHPLPAGTWTGEPLAPPENYQRATWQKNVNGMYRKDEISGHAMVIETTRTTTTTKVVTPAPGNQ
jgi:hypothetical protein